MFCLSNFFLLFHFVADDDDMVADALQAQALDKILKERIIWNKEQSKSASSKIFSWNILCVCVYIFFFTFWFLVQCTQYKVHNYIQIPLISFPFPFYL